MLARASSEFDLLVEWLYSDSDHNSSMRLAILRHLSYRDVVALMAVNYRFYQAMKDQGYWKEQLYRHFSFDIEPNGFAKDMPEAQLIDWRKANDLTPEFSCLDHFKVLTKEINKGVSIINSVFLNPTIYVNDETFLNAVKPLRLSYYEVASLRADTIMRIPAQGKAWLFSIIQRYFYQGRGFDYTKACEYTGMTFFQYAITFNCVAFVKSISNETFEELAPQYPAFIDTLTFSQYPEMLMLVREKGLSLDTIGTYGQTLLHNMVNQRNNRWVKFLCELGVDVNVRNQFGETPLHCAANTGNEEAFLLLINHGANPSLKKTKSTREDRRYVGLPEKSTLLHSAVRGRSGDIVKRIIDGTRSTAKRYPEGIINAVNVEGYSPLAMAAEMGQEVLFDLLLTEGAALTPGAINVHGDSMLHLAIRGENFNIVSRLMGLGSFDFNFKNAKGETPLHFIARYFKGPEAAFMINLFCRFGVDLEVKTNDSAEIPGATPLHYAVAYRQLNAVKQLLHEFVNVNAVTADGRTAVYLLIQSALYLNEESFKAMLKPLMKRKPDINLGKYVYTGEDEKLKERNGDTLVHAAVRSDGFVFNSVIKWPDVNINAQNANGDTPLHVSATGYNKCTNALLEELAAIDIVNNNNETPLVALVKKNKLKLVDFFYENGQQLAKDSLPGITEIKLSDLSIRDITLISLFEAMPNLKIIKLEGRVNITTDSRFPSPLQKESFASLETVDISEIDFWDKKGHSHRSLSLILASSPNVSRVVCEGITPEGVESLFEIYQSLAFKHHAYSQSMITQFVTGPHGFFATQPAEKRPAEGLDSPSKRTRLG